MNEKRRQQLTQRYVSAKYQAGATLDEISVGILDPAEQLAYVTTNRQTLKNVRALRRRTAQAGFLEMLFGYAILILVAFVLPLALLLAYACFSKL